MKRPVNGSLKIVVAAAGGWTSRHCRPAPARSLLDRLGPLPAAAGRAMPPLLQEPQVPQGPLIDVVVVLGLDAISIGLPVLAKQDQRGRVGSLGREDQVQQDEGVRIPALGDREEVQGDPGADDDGLDDDETPRSEHGGHPVGQPLAAGPLIVAAPVSRMRVSGRASAPADGGLTCSGGGSVPGRAGSGPRCHPGPPISSSGPRADPGPRTTTTGQDACCTQCWLTEPSSASANPPCPRLPTTSKSASADASSSTWAAWPWATRARTGTSLAGSRVLLIASATIFSALSRKSKEGSISPTAM